MGSFVQGTLGKDEKIIVEGRVSGWALVPSIIIGIITIPLFGLGIIIILSAVFTYISTELAVTNKRVVAKTGFIKRSTIELNLSKVESIQVHQGLFGRILNYGSLVVSGAGNPQAPIPNIADPMSFRRLATEAQEQFGK
ncbi:MAG: PH domain-containing protein [Chryseobacterium sp.]|jgi:uncharacterized membrane protein YdbT with pleckstrin-like domain|nr:PH domain-containing protein [Chryseobacterium sp.]